MLLTHITVFNAAAAEHEALRRATTRALELLKINEADYPHWLEAKVEVHVKERSGSGWLEYTLVRQCLSNEVAKASDQSQDRAMPPMWGHTMVIGMIQRTVGGEFEFHS